MEDVAVESWTKRATVEPETTGFTATAPSHGHGVILELTSDLLRQWHKGWFYAAQGSGLNIAIAIGNANGATALSSLRRVQISSRNPYAMITNTPN